MNKKPFGKALVLALIISAFGAHSLHSGAPLSPEQRVESFIAEYDRVHAEFSKSRKTMGSADSDALTREFKRWSAIVDRLDAEHFVDGGGRVLAGVMHGRSPHRVAAEKVIRTTREGERVFVETETHGAASFPIYYEYELRQKNADWRIVRLREYHDPADAPFMTLKERPRFENPKSHPLAALRKQEAGFDGVAIFKSGATIEDNGETSNIEVRRVGMLNVTSGLLAVGDLGYGPYTLSPVGQRIAPGLYPVEVSVAFKRVAALRLLVSNQPVAKWHPADMGDGGHGVGVDAGNISISDVSALLKVRSRDKERAFDKYAESFDRPNARMLSLVNADDVAIADSGYGDGRYPVYWGVDPAGKLAVLLVDFWVVPQPGRPKDED